MNHRVFERKWRSWLTQEHVCLSVRSVTCVRLLSRSTRPLRRRLGLCPEASLEVMESVSSPGSQVWFAGRVCRLGARPDCPTWSSPGGVVASRNRMRTQTEPQIRRDHPLNLSILISGGKETNKDSPSNGERSGNSSSLKSLAFYARELWPGEADELRLALSKWTWKGPSERVRAPCATPLGWAAAVFGESGCSGMQPKVGGKLHLKLNIGTRPIANKYREGKVKSTLKRESKRPRNR